MSIRGCVHFVTHAHFTALSVLLKEEWCRRNQSWRGVLSACRLRDERAWPKERRLWRRHLICDTHARPDKGHVRVRLIYYQKVGQIEQIWILSRIMKVAAMKFGLRICNRSLFIFFLCLLSAHEMDSWQWQPDTYLQGSMDHMLKSLT